MTIKLLNLVATAPLLMILLAAHQILAFHAPAISFANVKATAMTRRPANIVFDSRNTRLCMGIFDGIKNRFLDDRSGDFIKLNDEQDDQNEFGPGPLVVLYNVPYGVTNEEIQDMMEDGAPKAFRKGITFYRVDECNTSDSPSDPVLDMPMEQVLKGISSGKYKDQYVASSDIKTIGMPPPIVVLFFSGFRNDEMLAAYNILANEIYQEAQLSPACAKAVPNAMNKPLRQVLEEIGGDHRDAMQMAEAD